MKKEEIKVKLANCKMPELVDFIYSLTKEGQKEAYDEGYEQAKEDFEDDSDKDDENEIQRDKILFAIESIESIKDGTDSINEKLQELNNLWCNYMEPLGLKLKFDKDVR